MSRRTAVLLLLMMAACTPVGAPVQAPSARDAGCESAADGCGEPTGRRTSSARAGMSGEEDAGAAQKPAADGGAAQTRGAAGANALGVDSGVVEKPGASAAGSQAASSAGAGGSASDEMNAMTADTAAADELVRPAQSECEYVEVRARSDGAGTPTEVPPGDHSQCFLIDAGFDAPTQALEFKAQLDRSELVKHMVLRTWERSDVRGPIVDCNETNSTHNMVSLWAPGMDDWYFPADMGIELGRGLFHLEIHYINPGSAAVSDSSGMRVCTTKKLRPRTASMSWLGNQAFVIPGGALDYPVRGRCTPQAQTEPIRILRVAPFMNDLGQRFEMQIDRIDGSTFPLLEEMHTPQAYKSYDVPATLRVGDSILSTCYFNNPSSSNVSIGVEDGKELCHFFVLAYPAYALVNSGLINVENNSCLGSP